MLGVGTKSVGEMALGVGTRSEVFRRKWCQVWGLSMQEEIMLGIGTKSIGRNGARCRD